MTVVEVTELRILGAVRRHQFLNFVTGWKTHLTRVAAHPLLPRLGVVVQQPSLHEAKERSFHAGFHLHQNKGTINVYQAFEIRAVFV